MRKNTRFSPAWFLDEIGERLRWVREEAGHTQEKTANLIGCSQNTWSGYEGGTREPDPYLIVKFCARYKVDADYILRGIISGCDPDLAARLLARHPALGVAHQRMVMRMDMDREPHRGPR